MDADITVFENDDEGYLLWVRRHNGYVLTERAAGEYMLHDCDCLHLGRDDESMRLTARPRRCASATAPLRAWARERTGD